MSQHLSCLLFGIALNLRVRAIHLASMETETNFRIRTKLKDHFMKNVRLLSFSLPGDHRHDPMSYVYKNIRRGCLISNNGKKLH